jgi:hypothetical protein
MATMWDPRCQREETRRNLDAVSRSLDTKDIAIEWGLVGFPVKPDENLGKNASPFYDSLAYDTNYDAVDTGERERKFEATTDIDCCQKNPSQTTNRCASNRDSDCCNCRPKKCNWKFPVLKTAVNFFWGSGNEESKRVEEIFEYRKSQLEKQSKEGDDFYIFNLIQIGDINPIKRLYALGAFHQPIWKEQTAGQREARPDDLERNVMRNIQKVVLLEPKSRPCHESKNKIEKLNGDGQMPLFKYSVLTVRTLHEGITSCHSIILPYYCIKGLQ